MRIYLRAFESEDCLLIYKWRCDEEISLLLAGNKYFSSLQRERKWIEEKINNNTKDIYLSVCLKENNLMIGYTSINNIDYRNRKAEWGGTIIGEKESWGKGIAKEAAILMLQYIFEELGMNRCYGYCLEKHAITVKLFKSLGFQQEGTLRENVYKSNEYHNVVLFSLLKREHEEIKKKYNE